MHITIPYRDKMPENHIKAMFLVIALWGNEYTNFLLGGNQQCCKNMSHLNTQPVSKLLNMDEQLAIFMIIVGQGATNRQTEDRFQHSGETILCWLRLGKYHLSAGYYVRAN
ncbi:uncharacterized protein VP01_4274g2 [Puccinia sorghi]|uniref:DUF8040 domain-containing protein n=1 Tax=Puccinia sorghi TaxID=27349 RepID=A0A0L6US89_9BASI|nr:uncharacterized protein VP01_4274g2 [Puccinia sorghi]